MIVRNMLSPNLRRALDAREFDYENGTPSDAMRALCAYELGSGDWYDWFISHQGQLESAEGRPRQSRMSGIEK